MDEKNQEMNLDQSAKEKMPPTRKLNYKNIGKLFLILFAGIAAVSMVFNVFFSKKEKTEVEKEELSFFQEGQVRDELKDQDYRNRAVVDAVNQKLEENVEDEEIEVDEKPTPNYEADIEPKLTPAEAYLQEQELERLKRRFEARKASFAPSTSQGNISSSVYESSSNYSGGGMGDSDYLKYITAGIEQSADPNMQSKKKQYLKNAAVANFVLKEALTPAISKYEIKAGTYIPITLIPTILSDLPGQVSAVVREDVYDTLTGTEKLIPMGSKLYGEYNSELSWGQERVQVVFNRLTLPNGKSINLGSMIGGDGGGRAGMTGKVDMRIGKVIGSIIMAAVVGAAEGVLTNNGNQSEDKNAALATGGERAGEHTVMTIDKFTSKILDVQPRIEVPSGKRGTLVLDKDIILERYDKEIQYLLK